MKTSITGFVNRDENGALCFHTGKPAPKTGWLEYCDVDLTILNHKFETLFNDLKVNGEPISVTLTVER